MNQQYNFDFLFQEIDSKYKHKNIIDSVKFVNNIQNLNNVDKSILIQDSFLDLVIYHDSWLENLFKKDCLYVFKIIDFFYQNIQIFKNKTNLIKEYMRSKYFNLDNYFFNHFITDNDLNSINQEFINLINNIKIDKEKYIAYMIQKFWENNISHIYEDINFIGMIMILKYFYTIYYSTDKINQIDFSDSYQNFIKFYVKYNHIILNITEDKIYFQNSPKIPPQENTKDNILSFFHFCIENDYINMNILNWFFVIFGKELNTILYNDYFGIILNINNYDNGLVINVLKYIDMDYYNIDKQKLDNFLSSVKSSDDYYFKVKEDLHFENIDTIKSVINNIFLLKQIKDNKEIDFNFIKKIKEQGITKDLFFIFPLINPLEESYFENIPIYKGFNNSLKNLNFSYKVLNTIILNETSDQYLIFKQDKLESINKFTIDLFKYIDTPSYIYLLLLKLSDLYIIPVFDISYIENLNSNIINITNVLNLYNKIYPSKKNIINEYINKNGNFQS